MGYDKDRRKRAAVDADSSAKGVDRNARDSLGRRVFCRAEGCPCSASVYLSSGGNWELCSWHDVAEPKDWPRVTEELAALIAAGTRPAYPPNNPARWVLDAAAKLRAARASAPTPGWSSFGELAEILRAKRERSRLVHVPRELDEDEVNALLQEAGR